MKQERHKEVYREAFESANAELKEISAAFERLGIRKEQVEKLITVLGTLLDLEEKVAPPASEFAAKTQAALPPQPVESKPEGTSERVVADPFQRRIDHVLGIGAGIRDVRKYTRQF